MAEYPDLSAYEYLSSRRSMVNVGWPGRHRQFPTGPVPQLVVERLIRRPQHLDNVMRGVHYCEFCDEESPIRIPSPATKQGWVSLGNGELHICGADGTVFAAPSLIIHYITEHGYLPPDSFVDAVLGGD